MKIENIIFDFGGVIVDLDKQLSIDRFKEIGFDATKCIGSYVQSDFFAKLELGNMSAEEFRCCVKEGSSGLCLTDERIDDAWNSMLTGIPVERLNALERMKSKYNLYLLSNTNVIHWEKSVRQLFAVAGKSVEDYFDETFLSFELHLAKPGKEIFEHVLRHIGATPATTLFVDDSEANCNAAHKLGMNTFCPLTGSEWIDYIDNI